MGLTKKNLFSEEHNTLAAMAKALGHPARIAILDLLVKKGTCVCGDLVDELPLSQATVSQHLKALKDVGIITGEVDGSYRCYCIDQTCCTGVISKFSVLFQKMRNCC